MALKVGEVGKTIRVGTGYNMLSYTELTLTFTLPDDTIVTKATADGVILGTVLVVDPDIGSLAANEYMEYPIEPGFLSQSGFWKVYATYTDTTPTPDDIFIGDCVQFEVEAVCP